MTLRDVQAATRPLDPTNLWTLLAREDLGLHLLNRQDELDEGGLDEPVRWVHASDLLDPTPFLSSGMAILTTGRQFDGHTEDDVYRRYVDNLRRCGVRALGFGTGVVHDGIPAQLLSACRELRLPVFDVPYRTPFIAVARANAEAITALRYSRGTWALAAQRAIAQAAVRPDGLNATLAELSRQLGVWVGLFDAAGSLSREHPSGVVHPEDAAALDAGVASLLRRKTRASTSLKCQRAHFTLQTLGQGRNLNGVIAIAAEDLDQEERGLVTSVIGTASLVLEQWGSLASGYTALRAGLVGLLLNNQTDVVHQVARDVWGNFPGAPVVAAMSGPDGLHASVTDWLELYVHNEGGSLFFGPRDEGLLIILRSADLGVLQRVSRRFGLAFGISDPNDFSDVSRSMRQAEAALQQGTGSITPYADVARGGLLGALASSEGRALAHSRLRPLMQHDARVGTDLVQTLRTWLEHDARLNAAADALMIHRHTLRARVLKAQELLQTDLSAFPARAEVWAALEVTRRAEL